MRLLTLAATVLAVLPAVASASPRPAPIYVPPVQTGSTPVPSQGAPAALPSGVFGGHDPQCGRAGLSSDAVRACRGSGSPLSPFPTGNFGLDVHVDTGVASIDGNFAAIMQGLIGAIFTTLVDFLGTVFSWLRAAFGFDLFSADRSSRIPGALGSVARAFTGPLLPVALIVGGLIGLRHWFVARAEGKAVAHWLSMGAMIVGGLVLVADPVGILGGIDRTADQIASESLGIFASGHSSSGSFASAEPKMWTQAVERPWCALEFGSDTSWCMAPISGEAAAWRADALTNVSKADAGGDLGSLQQFLTVQACQKAAAAGALPPGSPCTAASDEALRLRLARTNGELWLAFPANDNARNGQSDSWTLYHHLLASRPDLAAIRGSGGVGDRLALIVLVGAGLVAFLLLLLYVALHLLAAALAFVILLLMAPVAVLLPALGERSRTAFARWAGSLLGVLFLKVAYSAFLGVLMLTSGIVASVAVGIGGGWVVAWGFWTGLWVLAFLHRKRLLQAFTLGMHQEAHRSIIGARQRMWARRAVYRVRDSRPSLPSPLRRERDQRTPPRERPIESGDPA